MPYRSRLPTAGEPVFGVDLRAPLRRLSCADDDTEPRRPGADGASHRCQPLASDYWNPPTSGPQRARQRCLAMIISFALAAALAHLGW